MNSQKRRMILSIIIIIVIIGVFSLFIGSEKLIFTLNSISKNPIAVLGFLIVFLGAFLFRALKWDYLLLPDRSERITLLLSLLVAWCLNSLFPARLGDISRIFVLKRKNSIEIGVGTASVVIDRTLDIISLISLFFLLTILFFNSSPNEISFFLLFLASLMLIGIIVIIGLFFLFPDKSNLLINKIFKFNSKIRLSLLNLFFHFHEGIAKILKFKMNFIKSLIISFPVWVLESLTVIFITIAIGIYVPFEICIISALVAFLAMLVPVTPAGFGSYELAMSITIYNLYPVIGPQNALLIALSDHLLRQIIVYVTGSISIFELGISLSQLSTNKSVTARLNEEEV